MKVITEERLRKMYYKKELLPNSIFILPENYLLTPSGLSYLKEHRIKIKKETAESIDKSDRSTSSTFIAEDYLIAIEIEHLISLLYFPYLEDDDLSWEEWHYLEKQQAWLSKFKGLMSPPSKEEGDFSNEKSKFLKRNTRRWKYTIGEMKVQIDKISYLLTMHQKYALAECFELWKTEFISIICLSENE